MRRLKILPDARDAAAAKIGRCAGFEDGRCESVVFHLRGIENEPGSLKESVSPGYVPTTIDERAISQSEHAGCSTEPRTVSFAPAAMKS